ncbi:hypothetical protein G6011_03226 [Alternaria panax]|uniref:Uncharacterized protein n=1 Tax=Alternaria panax TaxID=48097 RepID=A0AAD4NQQ9_9PLEO|nr:hypothetical protein G6011_03226 [Alternaria panax]
MTGNFPNSVPPFIFQIDEIFENLGDAPDHLDCHGIWKPTTAPYASHDYTPRVGASGKTWLCDGLQIRETSFPWTAQLYKTFSVYYASGAGFWVLEGDARNPPNDDVFHKLQFNYHLYPPESSYLTCSGQHNMLRVQPQRGWANMLLPDIYHTNAAPSSAQYGGLVGELPIFLALMAFTTSREYLPFVLPHLFTAGNWVTSHTWQFTRNERRGVVVKVYNCPADILPQKPRGSTSNDIYRYEIGETAKYFY